MGAAHIEFDDTDDKVKMAGQLAHLAGFSIGCIGLVDHADRQLVKGWISRASGVDAPAKSEALDVISKALRTSLSLGRDDTITKCLNGHLPMTQPTFIQCNQYAICIGNPVGNIAPMIAFVARSGPQQAPSAPRNVAELGLTYADQLLKEFLSSREEQGKLEIPEIILRSISFGLAVVDAHGTMCYMTDSSKSWLQSNKDMHVVNNRIVASSSHDQLMLSAAITDAVGEESKTSVLRLGTPEGQMQTVTVMPITESRELALLVFGRETIDDTFIRDLLLETYGLTLAERKLAQQLLCGKSLSRAAEDSNLKISTARSYLKTIFAKTGINRQSQLITLYHNMLPPLRMRLPERKRSIS